MATTRLRTWEITDEFWAKVETYIPNDLRCPGVNYRRKPGGGRKSRYGNRLYFSAIVYVLRTGIIWNALPRKEFENITSQAVHKKFMQWSRAGFFQKLWHAGLMEYDEMEGIAWEWQSVLRSENIFEKVISIKYDVPNNKLEMMDDYMKAVDGFYDAVMEKNA